MADEQTTENPEESAEASAEVRQGSRFVHTLSILRNNPIRTAVVLGVAGLIVAGIATTATFTIRTSEEELANLTLPYALARLDEEDFEEARRIATHLRLKDDLPFTERGGPPFILGAVLSNTADEQWNSPERPQLYKIAARYLAEAHDRGFPTGRNAQGSFLLGRAKFLSGDLSGALPYLHEAADAGATPVFAVQRMLAHVYYSDLDPNPDKALEHAQAYADAVDLPESERGAARLLLSQVLLRQGKAAQSAEIIASLGDDPKLRSQKLVMQARNRMAEAKRMRDANTGNNADINSKVADLYAAALQELRLAQASDALASVAARQAEYLIGVAYRSIGKLPAAEEQFSKTRRLYYETPEGLAASLAEAETQQLLGLDQEAIDSAERVVSLSVSPAMAGNPWVTAREIQDRLYALYVGFRDNGKFSSAIELAERLVPVFPKDRSIQLQAEAYKRWADDLQGQLTELEVMDRGLIENEKREKWFHAGRLFERLAKIRYTTRDYPEYLWSSVEGHMNAHNYNRAVQMIQEYLREEPRKRRPQALVAMGKSLVSLGQIRDALDPLGECIRTYPKHPVTYQARLIAAQSHLEEGEYEDAEELLIQNLENESLTPRSVEWRDSLYTLGLVYFRQGVGLETESRLNGVDSQFSNASKDAFDFLEKSYYVHHKAIEKLTQTVRRHEHGVQNKDPKSLTQEASEQALRARYLIAESHRHASKWPKKRLPSIIVENTRTALELEVREELLAALKEYDLILATLNTKQERGALSKVERAILRNSYFSRADAMYDMGKYEEALQAYSNATNRYLHEPEALEALVQMAGCHRNLGQPLEAQKQLDQAKVVLSRLDEGLDLAQTTRYSREDWKRLLELLTAFYGQRT